MSGRDDDITVVLPAIARQMQRALTKALKSQGVSPGQVAILSLLWSEGPLSPSAITDRLDVDASTVSGGIARLERDGLIRKEKDPDDGRGSLLHPTDHGEALRIPVEEALDAFRKDLTAQIPETTPAVLAALRKALS